MNRESCVIVGGAPIEDHDAVKKRLPVNAFVIYCDSGLRHRDALRLKADLIIGDFDSFDYEGIRGESAELIKLPVEKDDTDTSFAVKEAIKRGFKEIVLTGASGRRLDHTLVNVYLLKLLADKGIKGRLIDDYSEMTYLKAGETAYIDDGCCPFFSLLNIEGCAEGITIENARFPLNGAAIMPANQFCTSNEVQKGKTAKVSLEKGGLLLIKDFEG